MHEERPREVHEVHEARLERPTQQERNLALFGHLGIFAGAIVGPLSFLVPLIIWLSLSEDSEFVQDECKEALNFQITLFLLTLVGVLLAFILVGFVVLIGVAVIGVIFPILAAIQVSEGRGYRYPCTLRFIS